MCATVEGQCLEYWVCITLIETWFEVAENKIGPPNSAGLLAKKDDVHENNPCYKVICYDGPNSFSIM